ncbi:hypothetical protein [Aeromicrobium sp. Leaf350]|uniref:hypothetical protein n=1 Tax=Aeromicrobium sp. Leaf350 TaxID=2876565 RepID=UPI001E2A6AE5|nr:hypothetical protein [Aeromicrobium sp. Leaf350]
MIDEDEMTTQRTWRWLAVFLVVDAVLVGIMLRHLSGGSDDAPPTAAPTSSATPEPTAPPAPSAAVPGLVDSADALVVWGGRGSCSEGTPVTLDRLVGGTRDELDPGVTELLRLDVNDAGDVYVIGADADCAPVEVLLSAGSTEWVDPPGPIRRWHLTPGAATLTTPAGATDPGCPPVTYAAEGTSGVVGCADGTVSSSQDDGASWQTVTTVAGLTTLARTDDGLVVLAPVDGCAVAALRIEDGSPVLLGCASEEPADGPALLAQSATGFVAVVGDTVVRSEDGSTWEPAS